MNEASKTKESEPQDIVSLPDVHQEFSEKTEVEDSIFSPEDPGQSSNISHLPDMNEKSAEKNESKANDQEVLSNARDDVSEPEDLIVSLPVQSEGLDEDGKAKIEEFADIEQTPDSSAMQNLQISEAFGEAENLATSDSNLIQNQKLDAEKATDAGSEILGIAVAHKPEVDESDSAKYGSIVVDEMHNPESENDVQAQEENSVNIQEDGLQQNGNLQMPDTRESPDAAPLGEEKEVSEGQLDEPDSGIDLIGNVSKESEETEDLKEGVNEISSIQDIVEDDVKVLNNFQREDQPVESTNEVVKSIYQPNSYERLESEKDEGVVKEDHSGSKDMLEMPIASQDTHPEGPDIPTTESDGSKLVGPEDDLESSSQEKKDLGIKSPEIGRIEDIEAIYSNSDHNVINEIELPLTEPISQSIETKEQEAENEVSLKLNQSALDIDLDINDSIDEMGNVLLADDRQTNEHKDEDGAENLVYSPHTETERPVLEDQKVDENNDSLPEDNQIGDQEELDVLVLPQEEDNLPTSEAIGEDDQNMVGLDKEIESENEDSDDKQDSQADIIEEKTRNNDITPGKHYC